MPAVFQNSQTGLAAALNQDGSVNSRANPADIVTVFATGAAASAFTFPDGALVPLAMSSYSGPVLALTGYPSGTRSLEVTFAGDAPGLVAGVMQINFRLPDPLPYGNIGVFGFQLEISGVTSAESWIAVAQ